MSTLQARITRLEDATPPAQDTTSIILRRLIAPGEPEHELTAVRFRDRQKCRRLPDEGEDAFLERAEAAARAKGEVGIVMLVECRP